jgi:hypothetical protein
MPAAPVLGKAFANQINLDVQDECESQQLAVWEELLV